MPKITKKSTVRGLNIIERLPREVFHMMAHNLYCSKDRARLSRVSKRVHQLMVPLLYEKVIVWARENDLRKPAIPETKTYLKRDGTRISFESFKYVKDLQFVAPVKFLRRNRCGNDAAKNSLHGASHNRAQQNLAKHVLGGFENLDKDSLRSFSWNLGCCIPDEVLGASGYIPSNQCSIQSISLLTDGTCERAVGVAGLPKLRQLRFLTWKGMCPGNMDILLEALKANSAHLVYLDLDAVYNQSLELDNRLQFHEFRGSLSALAVLKFDSLRHLSLFNIPLASTVDEAMAIAPVFEQLESLKLLHCPGSPRLLTGLAKSDRVFKLRSFEFAANIPEALTTIGHPIEAFLSSCKGPERLFISTNLPIYLPAFLSLFSGSMKQLVHHPQLGVPPQDSHPSWWDLIDCGLRKAALEGVGLFASPDSLKAELQPMAAKHTFKLLHFRFTGRYQQPGEETLDPYLNRIRDIYAANDANDNEPRPIYEQLLRFAEWAFGATGLPSLRVIACGDFSHGERYEWTQVVLCRDSSGTMQHSQPQLFRILTRDEYEPVLGQIDGVWEMLSACATEPTFFQNGVLGPSGINLKSDTTVKSVGEMSGDGTVTRKDSADAITEGYPI